MSYLEKISNIKTDNVITESCSYGECLEMISNAISCMNESINRIANEYNKTAIKSLRENVELNSDDVKESYEKVNKMTYVTKNILKDAAIKGICNVYERADNYINKWCSIPYDDCCLLKSEPGKVITVLNSVVTPCDAICSDGHCKLPEFNERVGLEGKYINLILGTDTSEICGDNISCDVFIKNIDIIRNFLLNKKTELIDRIHKLDIDNLIELADVITHMLSNYRALSNAFMMYALKIRKTITELYMKKEVM